MEYYHELSGVMVDCAIILEYLERNFKDLYKYMKSKGFDVWMNNLIFKLLMSLFIENTHKNIYLTVLDNLFLFGDIILYKACILLILIIKNDIMKCKDIAEASMFFDQNLQKYDYPKFKKYLLNINISLDMKTINKQRQEKLPKIIEKIKTIRETAKKNNSLTGSNCNLDWPYCVTILEKPKISNVMKFKIIEKPLIENNYFDLSHNVYKLAEHPSLNNNIEKENDDEKRKTIIYGNLLIERNFHECNSKYSSREEILGLNSYRKSSLMNVFFEENEKSAKNDNNITTSNSEELMEIVTNKNDFMHSLDKSVLIESVIDPLEEEVKNDNKDDEDDDNILCLKTENEEEEKEIKDKKNNKKK